MSHLLDEINSVNQNTTGQITLDIEDVNSITISNVQTNDMLEVSGSAFVNTTSDSLVKRSSYPLTKSGYNVPTISNYTAYAYFEDLYTYGFYFACRIKYYSHVIMNTFNNSDNSVLAVYLNSNAGYICGFTIKANQPTLLYCYSGLTEDSDSTAYADMQWRTDSGTILGPKTRFKRLEDNNRNTVVGYINPSTDTKVGLKRVTSNGNFGWTMSEESRRNFIMIAKRVF